MFNNNNYNSQGVPEWMAYGGVPVGLPKGAVPQNAIYKKSYPNE